jgi:hypothetical protein
MADMIVQVCGNDTQSAGKTSPFLFCNSASV